MMLASSPASQTGEFFAAYDGVCTPPAGIPMTPA